MEKASPTGSVTRAHVYVATHVYQELPKESLDPESYEAKLRTLVRKVRELLETDKFINETHLDRDAVTE
ncbi:hypothetical protein MKX01_037890, partial [Papaver californicum]